MFISIQGAIESNSNPINLTSPLLAWDSAEAELPILSGASHNFTVGQDRILQISSFQVDTSSPTQVSFFQTNIHQNSIGQISISEVNSPESTIGKVSSREVSFPQTSIVKKGLDKAPITQVGSEQISATQHCLRQHNVLQVGASKDGILEFNTVTYSVGQVSASQVNSLQVRPTQVGFIQVSIDETGSRQISTAQVSTRQINPAQIENQTNTSQVLPLQVSPLQVSPKLAFPSSVSLQQFLSSHNFNLQNTTIPTWTEFLTGTTPFNFNIEITDRPTGHPMVSITNGQFDQQLDRPQIHGTIVKALRCFGRKKRKSL